jgi:hypothetical protein
MNGVVHPFLPYFRIVYETVWSLLYGILLEQASVESLQHSTWMYTSFT